MEHRAHSRDGGHHMKHTTTSDGQALAERLKKAREMAGLSQGKVAKMLGMHRPTITEIEACNRKVSSTELATFANLYNVSPSSLFLESPVKLNLDDPKLRLAARELWKLKSADLKR